jgi:hypothetical protein
MLVIGQSKTPRDSSASKKPQRTFILKQDAEKPKNEADRAKVAAEKANIKAEEAKPEARVKAHIEQEAWDFDVPEVEPIIENAFELIEPAMEQARAALENIDWGEINSAMDEASAALAEMPPLPPLPDIPPIPDIPPLPDFSIGFGRSWGFGSREYKKNLSDNEQLQLQALAALLDRDEKAALPEIERMARQHENWAMRASAVTMLSGSESSEVIPILEEVLNKDADKRVRRAAVHALSCREEPEAREVLKRLLQK